MGFTLLQVLINAGQANAATGDAGYQDCIESAKALSEALGISENEVLLLSTGVIGRRIKLDALKESVPKLASSLGDSVEDAHHAAVAITTTDLVSKSAALEVGMSTLVCLANLILISFPGILCHTGRSTSAGVTYFECC